MWRNAACSTPPRPYPRPFYCWRSYCVSVATSLQVVAYLTGETLNLAHRPEVVVFYLSFHLFLQ
ncbi:hypothetical protein DFAR_630069 [Desulfarculales bacterium]